MIRPLFAEVAGLPDSYAVPLSLAAAIVLALVAALVAVYRELRLREREAAAKIAELQEARIAQAQENLERTLRITSTVTDAVQKLAAVAALLEKRRP